MTQEKNNQPVKSIEEKFNAAFHLFLYLVKFVALGFVIGSVINILMELVNKKMVAQEELQAGICSGVFQQGSVRFSISALLVAAPIYFGLLFFVNKKLDKGEILPTSWIRKGATYLALTILAIMSLGGLVALVFNYFEGALVGKLFYKIFIFIFISTLFAVFYLWEVRRKEFSCKFFRPWFAGMLILTVLTFITGFLIVDRPSVVRGKKVDATIIRNLDRLEMDIQDKFNEKKKLPEKKDLDLGEKIKYQKIDDKAYKLCAQFVFERNKKGDDNCGSGEYDDWMDKKWNHPAGEHCFDLEVKEENDKSR